VQPASRFISAERSLSAGNLAYVDAKSTFSAAQFDSATEKNPFGTQLLTENT